MLNRTLTIIFAFSLLMVSVGCKKQNLCESFEGNEEEVSYDLFLLKNDQKKGDTLGYWKALNPEISTGFVFSSMDVLYTQTSEKEGFVILNKDLSKEEYQYLLSTNIYQIELDFGKARWTNSCSGDQELSIGSKTMKGTHNNVNGFEIVSFEADTAYQQPKCVSSETPMHSKSIYFKVIFNADFDWEVEEAIHDMKVSPSSGIAGENCQISISLKDNGENTSLERYRIQFFNQFSNKIIEKIELWQGNEEN